MFNWSRRAPSALVFVLSFFSVLMIPGMGSGAPVVSLPEHLEVHNAQGIDHAGLCVWAATATLAGYAQHECWSKIMPKMAQQKGGGWEQRVDIVYHQPDTPLPYVQYVGLKKDFILTVLDHGFPVAVTYNWRAENGVPCYHMIVLLGIHQGEAFVFDNRFPGKRAYRRMPEAQFWEHWSALAPRGWAVCVLGKLPPPKLMESPFPSDNQLSQPSPPPSPCPSPH